MNASTSAEFGDFALKFGISYFVQSADYTRFCDIQQQINFAIMEEFEREGIEMAYPTSTVYVKKETAATNLGPRKKEAAGPLPNFSS